MTEFRRIHWSRIAASVVALLTLLAQARAEPVPPAAKSIKAEETAILLVDFQANFVSPDGAWYGKFKEHYAKTKMLDRIVELEATFLEQQQRRAGCNQLGVGEDTEDVIDAQRSLRFLVRPPDTIHIDQIPAYEHRGRDSGKDVRIDTAAHGGVCRAKIVPVGSYLHVFHRRPLLATRHKPLAEAMNSMG